MRNPEQPPIYEHDRTTEDLEVSQGVELEYTESYTRKLELAQGAHQQSLEELKAAIDQQDPKEFERALRLVASEYNTLVTLAKTINDKLEAEVKEKYQLLKNQQPSAN